MPANLPPQYYEIERKYKLAKTYEEKIAILQEMLAIMPKHKGTDKLQADLRAKISKLRKASEKKPGAIRKAYRHHIPREGAAQVTLIGPPNVGKSQILDNFTNATPQIAPYPFTTGEPVVGMMPLENIKIQVVDTPPITNEFLPSYLPSIIRETDLALLVVDLSSDEVLDQMEMVIEKLKEVKIKLVGKMLKNTCAEGIIYKKTLIIGNKKDTEGAEQRLEVLRDLYKDEFSIISISAINPSYHNNIKKVKREIYRALNIIRIYTKAPGKPVDLNDPIVLKERSKVIDAARAIHKDFANNLKYAKMWRKGKFDAWKVDKDYPLEEGDVVEFHI